MNNQTGFQIIDNFASVVSRIRICMTEVSSSRVGISGTTANLRQRKFVPSSHPGPLAVVGLAEKQVKKGRFARM